MPSGPSIVDDVRRLLKATEQGSLNQGQFETKRSALLLAAEADLIQRREALSDGLAAGTITGMQAADIRAELDRAEKALREAASLAGVTAAKKDETAASSSPVQSGAKGPSNGVRTAVCGSLFTVPPIQCPWEQSPARGTLVWGRGENWKAAGWFGDSVRCFRQRWGQSSLHQSA